MTENNQTESVEDNRSFYQKHPTLSKILIGGAAVLTIIGGYGLMTMNRYSTLAKGTVIEEKWIDEMDPKQEEVKARHYVLNVHVKDEIAGKKTDKVCTLYVANDSAMPRAVLDDVVKEGSEVYLPYLEPGRIFGEPEPIYQVGCFGKLGSSKLRVVHPWESSEKVRKKFGDKLEQRLKKERQEAYNEMMDAAYEDFTVDAFF